MSRIMIILFAGLTILVCVADVLAQVRNCPGDNEEYRCGLCQKTCATLDTPCSVVTRICGCYCEEGYVREKYPWDRCIDVDECAAHL